MLAAVDAAVEGRDQLFDGHFFVEEGVLGLIDKAETAPSQLVQDVVVAVSRLSPELIAFDRYLTVVTQGNDVRIPS